MKKQTNRLSPSEAKVLLLRNSKKLMSEKYRTEIPEISGEKKKK